MKLYGVYTSNDRDTFWIPIKQYRDNDGWTVVEYFETYKTMSAIIKKYQSFPSAETFDETFDIPAGIEDRRMIVGKILDYDSRIK